METTMSDVVDVMFTVGRPAELSLSGVSGRVSVRPGEESTIHVRAVKRGNQRAKENTRVDVVQEGNRVNVHTRTELTGLGALLNLGINMSSVDYDVEVPVGCSVQLKTVSADVIVEGTRGPVRIQSVSGAIRLSGVKGECSVSTVSGDITAEQIDGALTLHSTSGDARIIDSDLRGFNLHSVSGDFVIETPLQPGEHYYANTVSGDLAIRVPEGTGAMVQMKSVSGDVVSDLPAEVIKSGRRHWQGRINGGGAHVEMHSVSGDLRIGRVGGNGSRHPGHAGHGFAPVPPTPPTPPTPPAPPTPRTGADPSAVNEDAATILRALEQGEIDVDEALRRLKGTGR